jgi:hypothetical protein
VRDVPQWLRGTLASRGIRVFEDQSAAAILFVGSTTELRCGADNQKRNRNEADASSRRTGRHRAEVAARE